MEPVIFKPIPQQEIEDMVFRNLEQQAKDRKLQLAERDNTIGWNCIIFGVLVCFIPGGVFIGAVLLLTGIYFLVTGAIWQSKSRKVTPSSKKLKGKTYNMRNAGKGNCPVCDSEIIVDDCVSDHRFQCAVCTANLRVQNYEVTAR